MDMLQQAIKDAKGYYMECKAAYGAKSCWTIEAKQHWENLKTNA